MRTVTWHVWACWLGVYSVLVVRWWVRNGVLWQSLTKVKCNNKTDGMNPMICQLQYLVNICQVMFGRIVPMIHDLQCWVKRQNVRCCFLTKNYLSGDINSRKNTLPTCLRVLGVFAKRNTHTHTDHCTLRSHAAPNRFKKELEKGETFPVWLCYDVVMQTHLNCWWTRWDSITLLLSRTGGKIPWGKTPYSIKTVCQATISLPHISWCFSCFWHRNGTFQISSWFLQHIWWFSGSVLTRELVPFGNFLITLQGTRKDIPPKAKKLQKSSTQKFLSGIRGGVIVPRAGYPFLKQQIRNTFIWVIFQDYLIHLKSKFTKLSPKSVPKKRKQPDN